MGLLNEMKKENSNVSVTENGNVGYKTTYHPLVDMNFKLPSYRNKKNLEKLIEDIKAVMESDDAKYILKYVFFLRDVRQGLGERNTFREILKDLANNYEFANKDEIFKQFIDSEIADYGRWDDVLCLIYTKYRWYVISKIKSQLNKDFDGMKEEKPISLLAKWLPSCNTSSYETRKLAQEICKEMKCTQKEYRKILSTLRSYLKVVEVQTSANQWESIDYNTVPSNANIKYMNAFLKHDEERRRKYINALITGKDENGNEVKVNASVNFPHQVVHKYGDVYRLKAYDEFLEQLWKNLPEKEGLSDTIVVRDGSGSMTCHIGNSDVSAMDVSTALTIYCSERLRGEWKNHFITFSATAKVVDLTKCASLHTKLQTAYKYSECSNTNIANVFETILRTAKNNHISVEDMPKQILIISDMEFDGGYFNADANVFEEAERNFKLAGYTLPKLVFWNVNSRTNTIPMRSNEQGVILVSGFSVNILDMVMSGKTDPFEVLVEKLESDRYKDIPYLSLKEKKEPVKVTEKPSWLK